jgi:TolA-binding protein
MRAVEDQPTPVIGAKTVTPPAATATAAPREPSGIDGPPPPAEERRLPPMADGLDDLERGFQYALRGDFDSAVVAWATWLQGHPKDPMAEKVRGGLEAAARLRSLVEARYNE